MNAQSQDIGEFDHNVSMQADSNDLSTRAEISPALIDHECRRYPLWDIHQYIEKVLATDKPGFLIICDKHGRKTVRELSLGWYYKQIRSFVDRIPPDSKPSRYIGLFQECANEMGLSLGFTLPGISHGQGVENAERYNAFLDLIRTKAATVAKYIKATKYISNYDKRIFDRLKKHVDGLFAIYSKLLVVRLDLEYQQKYTGHVTLAQAKKDIGRFVSHRRFHRLFKHCVGFVIAREHGKNGCGFHFHCMLFFDGQKQNRDLYLASAIGKDYWEGYITRIAGDGATLVSRGRHFNCNIQPYDHNGIGMISHSDEVKRADLLYALVYLTKDDQDLGIDASPKTRLITRSILPRVQANRSGPPRKILLRGKRVTLPKKGYSPDIGLNKLPYSNSKRVI